MSLPCQPSAPPGSGSLHTYQVLLSFRPPPPVGVKVHGYFSGADCLVSGGGAKNPIEMLENLDP
ncbi:hypothetical protein EYF80_067560 [Liparis tanakae]|uniref:Uncharacterized protein n=1 Tax=Liparis tanakae TaxID=230148 RepID=A0A4Z2E0J0_9TELE|nr:hypothetical protein EYF80_067560 [Liparis tanakae]